MGDTFRFYEINPQVIDVAQQKFTFLSKTSANVEIVLGDARLQLEYEPNQKFDVLVIDAFSGDSAPIHLLTQEAFTQYFRHLKKDGVLALHITNRFLDLKPVVKAAADQLGVEVRILSYVVPEAEEGFRSHWVLMSSGKDYFQNANLANAQLIKAQKNFKPWKDDYSSLISIMY
ncbi:spermidine synthase [Polynucleobacter necessarius]|uniref:spermidine synthase n=1 Tax=Polynucleobacter necessarius TaxID=576610 RepID=UPI000E09318A|nr:fused MFS/spermidine synthase [Polynucleobacter necessarius]